MAADDSTPGKPGGEPVSPVWSTLGRVLGRIVDPLVVPSFDRTGYWIHSLRFEPDDLAVDLSAKRCVVTGANSGIGYETARGLASLGARVVLGCRNRGRGEEARERIRRETGNDRLELEVFDIANFEQVAEVGQRLASDQLDVLVHNAGVLPEERICNPSGFELTWATHVLGPHLLTQVVRGALAKGHDGRVIWVSSGGMYTRQLNLDDIGWVDRSYDGVVAYAETKRAQVVLSELWAEKFRSTRVTVNAMHPGWADTPSVERSLPAFPKWMGTRLRTPAEGADTVVWLAACPHLSADTGKFWFDREERRSVWFPGTREFQSDRRSLWKLCEDAGAEFAD